MTLGTLPGVNMQPPQDWLNTSVGSETLTGRVFTGRGLTTRDTVQAIEHIRSHFGLNFLDYLFDSPVLGYNDYWIVDEATDRIVASKHGPHEGNISNSERMFLGLWRAHFNGNGEYLAKFNMRSFDSSNQRKALFFLGIARAFPWS